MSEPAPQPAPTTPAAPPTADALILELGKLLQQLDKLKETHTGNQRMVGVALPYGSKHGR